MTETPSILLVEDNDLDVEILQRGLKKAEMNNPVTRAYDGIDALQILSQHAASPSLREPLIVLLDINMPRMNGHEFLKEMRSKPELGTYQVFVFTTSNSTIDIERAYENHANGYFVKPTGSSELQELLAALKKYLAYCQFANPSRRLS